MPRARTVAVWAALTLAVPAVVLLSLHAAASWWWFEVHSGTTNEPGPYYGFFSGFGSDLGEYAILVGVAQGVYLHWKHINCHAPGCPRVGRFNDASGQFKFCHHHHPEMMGNRLSLEEMHGHHWRHREQSQSSPVDVPARPHKATSHARGKTRSPG